MTRYTTPDGVTMTLTLPCFAGLLLLLLAVIDPSIRYAPNFHNALTTLLYLGFVTSVIVLVLGITKRIGSSWTSKICFVLSIAWLLYTSVIICIISMFTRHG